MGLPELLLAAKKDTSGIACPEEKREAEKRIAARHAEAAAIDASGFVSRSASSEDGSNSSRAPGANDDDDDEHNAYEGDDGNQSGSTNSPRDSEGASDCNEDDPNTDTIPEKADATSIDIDLQDVLNKIKSPAVQYGVEKDADDTNPDKAEAPTIDTDARRVELAGAHIAAQHRLRQKRSKSVLDGDEDDHKETDEAAQYKVVTDYLSTLPPPPKGFDREMVTKYLNAQWRASADSSLSPTVNTDLADNPTKIKRPAVKSNSAAALKRKKTAATSFVPETQEDIVVPATRTADTSLDPSLLIALKRANTTAPPAKKQKKASSSTHKSKRAALPVMAPNQKPSTLTSEQAGTCAFYKEYLKAAVHAIAPQDPPHQPFFYVGRGQHAACRWLTDGY